MHVMNNFRMDMKVAFGEVKEQLKKLFPVKKAANATWSKITTGDF